MDKKTIYCEDYPTVFKNFTIVNTPPFQTYKTIRVKTESLLMKRTHYKGVDFVDLPIPYFNSLLQEIIRELTMKGFTHLLSISETHIMYNPITLEPEYHYFVRGSKILGNKQDGLEILNDFIKSKDWFEGMGEPFEIIKIDNEELLLKFNRRCASKIYHKGAVTQKNWIKLDQYLIEIVYDKLEEFGVDKIVFKVSNNTHYQNQYVKIGKKWLPGTPNKIINP